MVLNCYVAHNVCLLTYTVTMKEVVWWLNISINIYGFKTEIISQESLIPD